MQYTVIEAAWPYVAIYILIHTHLKYMIVRCEYEYIIADLIHYTVNISGRMPITVLAQSTNVTITINGSGEVYSCTLNDQTVHITSGQTVQQTGLTPNTTYTVNCHSVNDSCLEATTTTFTTGTVYVYCYICYTGNDTLVDICSLRTLLK